MAHTLDVIGHAHLEGVKGVKDIQLGDRDFRHRIQPHCMSQHDGIKPAWSPTTLCVHPVLMTQVDNFVTGFIKEFSGHWARANAGDIGLCNANHSVNVTWPHTSAHTRSTRNRIG